MGLPYYPVWVTQREGSMCHQQVPLPLHVALNLSMSPSTASPRFSLGAPARFSLGAPARPLCVWQAVFSVVFLSFLCLLFAC